MNPSLAFNFHHIHLSPGMKDLINKPAAFQRLEFWAATTIYVFAVFFLITHAVNNVWPSGTVNQSGLPVNYFFTSKFIRYTILYLSFLLLNFSIVPKLIKKENLFLTIFQVVLLFLLVGLLLSVTEIWLKNYLFSNYFTVHQSSTFIFQKTFLHTAWLLMAFGFYTAIKYASLYLLTHAETVHKKYKLLTPNALAAFVIWMIILFLLLIGSAPSDVIAIWTVVIPTGVILYSYSFFKLIPTSMIKKNPFRAYLGRCVLFLLLSFLPVMLLATLIAQDDDSGAAIAFFNLFFHLLITTPLTWMLFKRQMKGDEEIFYLKQQLGRSTANFDFLRSQINPHFLFNALNTIYGTAIQEKADRTSEGIEKLGDMMRFMLQENMQEKIPLSREIDYLRNYISLQKLRTDPTPMIRIEDEIDLEVFNIQIAPMLLIPFVENAFKHGISFREPSHIKVSLELKENKLYFDVNNSKHLRSEQDPEKNKSGIGLTNVKQRLQLLYPKKHELVIRETSKEYFVHLTLELK